MSTSYDLLQSLQGAANGLALAEILVLHPDLTRRTAQRLIAAMVASDQVTATGDGRGRRYYARNIRGASATHRDDFPKTLPLSTDSQDILAYVRQPLDARKPVAYQRDFLDAYQPNKTWYLTESLRRQLRKMGETGEVDAPA